MNASAHGGPFVQVAAFCERAIIEQDTGNLSLINLIDRGTRLATDGETSSAAPVSLTLAICLWAGTVEGEGIVKLRPTAPDEAKLGDLEIAVSFTQDDTKGINIVHPIQLALDQAGIYWFDVLFSHGDPPVEQKLSTIPLEIQTAAIPT